METCLKNTKQVRASINNIIMVSIHMLWNYKHFLVAYHQAEGINDRIATDMPVLNFFSVMLLNPTELCRLEHQYTDWQSTEWLLQEGIKLLSQDLWLIGSFSKLHFTKHTSKPLDTFSYRTWTTQSLSKKKFCLGVMSGKDLPVCLQMQKY